LFYSFPSELKITVDFCSDSCSSGECIEEPEDPDPPPCSTNYASCDNSNSCEVHLPTDINNCGSCGNSCSSSQTCDNGVCQSPPPPEEECDFPDGSSSSCDCDGNSDCPSGYFCNLVSGPDACEEIDYEDECNNHNNYFCDGERVKQCVNNGNYWEEDTIEKCSGKYEYCDPNLVDGIQRCSTHPNHLDVWIDYAETGVEVYKQPEDKITLNINSEQSTTVNINYNSDVFEGNCPIGSFSISPGINTCELTVKPTAPNNRANIVIDSGGASMVASITITDSPEFLIITDSEKLKDRYPGEENGVCIPFII